MRLAYWMYQGTAHYGIGRIANSLRNIHAVFHAPQGDAYINAVFAMLERTPAFPPLTTSVVSGRDLAQGNLRLPETLQAIDQQLHPELIVVAASCSTTLLQENLEVAAESADISAEVLIYDVNPYRVQEVAAADGLFTELVRRYATATPLTTQPSVNILGPASMGLHARHDLTALRRMLQTLGVQVNVVAPWGATLDDLRRLPAAWLNIAPYRELGQQAAQVLHEQFGTPSLCDAPIGVQPTLAWLHQLVEQLNSVGSKQNNPSEVMLPPLTAFSLDGLSTPSSVPWFVRTADMESFSRRRMFVFGDATHVAGMTRFLHDELGTQICGAGTYLPDQADWLREQLAEYVDDLLVTEEFQVTAQRIEELQPDLVCGTQMERHTARKLGLQCMVIAPPMHIENHPLSYRPFLGFDGADVIADQIYMTSTLGMEQHLIDMFGDAGLEVPPMPETEPVLPLVDPVLPAVPLTEESPTPAAPVKGAPLADDEPVEWQPDAEAMMKKIPFFVRNKARRNIEQYARAQGYRVITTQIVLEAREHVGG
ncbi:MAG: ferredoxin:protochlorophyllide reductase (ATP-dependent) subunit B [Chloroflexaceae bacterium]|nr:ferredoxin:protochlorophyllide reductase (ATP-dependent) subunit B [Chloroflexaceae bacterium]